MAGQATKNYSTAINGWVNSALGRRSSLKSNRPCEDVCDKLQVCPTLRYSNQQISMFISYPVRLIKGQKRISPCAPAKMYLVDVDTFLFKKVKPHVISDWAAWLSFYLLLFCRIAPSIAGREENSHSTFVCGLVHTFIGYQCISATLWRPWVVESRLY